MKEYQRYHPSVSYAQMEALKLFISVSGDISDFAKKAVIFLLSQTENLSLPVHLCIPGKLGREVQNGVHYMRSINGKMHICYFLRGMRTHMDIQHHCGLYDKSGRFNSNLKGSTIWVSVELYDDNSKEIAFNKKEIEKVYLSKTN